MKAPSLTVVKMIIIKQHHCKQNYFWR